MKQLLLKFVRQHEAYLAEYREYDEKFKKFIEIFILKLSERV